MKKKSLPWHLLPTVASLAWPTMLEQLAGTAVQYIDTAMVGLLGTEATAAVGSTGTVNWLISSAVSALGVGFLSQIARANGAGEQEKAKRIAAQAVLLTFSIGLLFTVLCLVLSPYVPRWMQVDPAIRETASRYFFIIYAPMIARAASIIFGTVLRAAGDTRTPMRIGIGVNIINVVLNFFLIYETRQVTLLGMNLWIPGAGWGVIGAAAASAVSFAYGGVAITVALFRHRTVSPRGYTLMPDKTILKPCLTIAWPNLLQRVGTSLGYVVFASMINSLGEVSTAAHTLANTVESLFYIPGYGMQAATSTLAGNAYGAGDKQRMKDLARLIFPVEILLMIVSGGLLFLLAPKMMHLFSSNPEVIDLGSAVLRMVAVSEPFYGVTIIIEGMMQGVGDTLTPFILGISTMWLVRIGGTFITICCLHMGLTSAWACMILHNLTLFALLTARYAGGKWNPLNKPEPKPETQP